MGALLTTDKSVVVNSGNWGDAPGGCTDAVFTQVIPVANAGTNYIVVRGNGYPGTASVAPEQSTIIATEDNTSVTVNNYDTSGVLIGTNNYTLATAGNFQSIFQGDTSNIYSSSNIISSKPVVVYQGVADNCENDMAMTPPLEACSGSNRIEIRKFRSYADTELPYVGNILIHDAVATVYVNGADIEAASGNTRFQIGNTGYYLIRFTNANVSNQEEIIVSSTARMSVSIVEEGGGFSMAGFYSSFSETPEQPFLTSTSSLCSSSLLTAEPGLATYQWYLDGNLIAGATNQTYVPTASGNYSVSGTRTCGVTKPSPNFLVTCAQASANLSLTKTVDNATPVVGTNVTFTITATNNGPNDTSGVTVTDALPSGYTLVSATPSTGSWAAPTWSIGNLANGASATLTVVATINSAGDFNNVASISGNDTDPDLTNNTASSATSPQVSGTCNTNILSNPSFENPVEPNVNDNNIHTPPYSGWYTQNGAALNIIRVDGTGYPPGPNNAHGTGNQYLDIANSTDYPIQTFTITNSSSFAYSGWFSSRDGYLGSAGYLPWIARVDILDPSDNIVATSPFINFTYDTPKETWYYVSGTTPYLPPGTYKYRAFVGDYGHLDDAYLCITPLQSDLAVTKTVNPSNAAAGTNVTFTITATNNGPNDGTGVSVTDALPSGYTLVSATPSAGTYSGSTWSIGTLANGASATLTVVATVNPTGSYTNTASITGYENDPTTTNNTSTSTPNVIDAVNDGTTVVNGSIGATLPSVLANDTLNGLPLNPSDVTLTPGATPAGITMNPDGTVTVSTGTTPGTYSISYTICSVANPTNCDTATTTVVVTTIDAINDTPTALPSVPGGTTPSVLANDTLNGLPLNPSDVTLTPGVLPSGLTMNPDGSITVASGTPNGTYPVSYTICEVANPTICDTATVTVVIVAIDAVNDTPVAVADGQSTPSVILNDTLNGTAAVIGTNPGQVALTPVTVPSGLTLNADGTITVNANTPSGTYTVTYQICENLATPANCDTATATVVVTNIVAVNDPLLSVNTQTGNAVTPSVFINDTLNGLAFIPSQVILTTISIPPGLTLNLDGTITVAQGTSGGFYTVYYSICEASNPTICSNTATAIVFVESPSLALLKTATFNDENGDNFVNANETISYSFTVTNTGNVPLTNIIINDPLNGVVMYGGPINLGVGQSDSSTFTATYHITQADINSGNVTNQATVFGTSPLGVIVQDLSDGSSLTGDTPTVYDINGCIITVFNGITPDGDGENDILYIQGLECYPENSVEIYNRWGVLVFERDGYNNTDRAFRGISEGRVTIEGSKELPAGTYFYVLKYKKPDGSQIDKAGYLYLNR